jgi:hypothetical protein
MRTCCPCPDQAGLHTGDGAGPASDLSKPSASAISCRPDCAASRSAAPDDLGRFRDRARVGGGVSSARLAIWAVVKPTASADQVRV